MNSNQEQLSAEFEAENIASLDDFLKELEEKEKDLNISAEVVVEVDDDALSDDSAPETLPADIAGGGGKGASVQPFTGAAADNAEAMRLREQLIDLEIECQELRTTLSRRQKDFENYRLRIEREKGDAFRSQVGHIAMELLPVVDNLNRALDAATDFNEGKTHNYQQFFDGIMMVNQQLNEILAEMGVEQIPSIGEPFNPEIHDAAAAEQSDDVPPNTVTAEFLRGYRIGDKVIRAAVVKVSS